MREFAKKFYNSAAWDKCRAAYISKRRAIDGGLCETCRRRYGHIVHHRIWLTPENVNDPEVALNMDNLKYDCLTCHNKEKERGDVLPEILFDEDGQPIPPP